MQDYFSLWDLACLLKHVSHQKGKQLSTERTNANLPNFCQQFEPLYSILCPITRQNVFQR